MMLSGAPVCRSQEAKAPLPHTLGGRRLEEWKYGPPRVFWCFGFEAFNRLIKKACNLSNYKNEVLTAMQFWSMRSARRLRKARLGKATWLT